MGIALVAPAEGRQTTACSDACAASAFRLAAGSGLLLVALFLASMMFTRPNGDAVHAPVYRLGVSQQTGLPASVGISPDGDAWALNVGAPLAVAGPLDSPGGPSLHTPLLDGRHLGLLFGAVVLGLLGSLVMYRSRGGNARWGCQCGERPLVRAGIPDNVRGERAVHG